MLLKRLPVCRLNRKVFHPKKNWKRLNANCRIPLAEYRYMKKDCRFGSPFFAGREIKTLSRPVQNCQFPGWLAKYSSQYSVPSPKKKQNRDGHSAVFVVVILHKALYVRAVCVFFVFDDGFPEHIAGSVGIGVVYSTDIALIVKLVSPDSKHMGADGIPFSDGEDAVFFIGIYNVFIENSAVKGSAQF